MKLTVNVTQGHINQGCRRAASNCPVRNAVFDALKAADRSPFDVTVDGEEIQIYLDFASTLNVRLPDHVRDWVRNFDDNGPTAVQPITFEIEV